MCLACAWVRCWHSTTKEAWASAKGDAQRTSDTHLAFAKELQEHVERPLLDFREQQKNKRKDTEATISKDRKAMAVREAEIERARKQHQQRARDAEAAERAATKAMMNDKKEFGKFDTLARNERKKASAAGDDYQRAVDEYVTLRKVWEEDLKQAFEDYQDVEIKRIEFVRAVLENYLNSDSNLRDKRAESAAAVRKAVEEMSTEKDIEVFVKTRGTGPRKPLSGSVDQYTK